MMNVKFGVVKFFNNNAGKKFGFIKPDESREDGRDVFFHRNNAVGIFEDFSGELDLEIDVNTWVEREPHKGDRIVYLETEHSKGPTAFEWNYEDAWKKAEAVIAARPWPECPMCRVVWQQEESPWELKLLWRGYYPHLMELISMGEAPFLQDKERWYRHVWCEELKATGKWERMWNPLDARFPKFLGISDEHRKMLVLFTEPKFFNP